MEEESESRQLDRNETVEGRQEAWAGWRGRWAQGDSEMEERFLAQRSDPHYVAAHAAALKKAALLQGGCVCRRAPAGGGVLKYRGSCFEDGG